MALASNSSDSFDLALALITDAIAIAALATETATAMSEILCGLLRFLRDLQSVEAMDFILPEHMRAYCIPPNDMLLPPNGLELRSPTFLVGSGPAKTPSQYRAAVAGSALEDPAFFAGQRVVRQRLF